VADRVCMSEERARPAKRLRTVKNKTKQRVHPKAKKQGANPTRMTTVSTADWIAACVGAAEGDTGLVLSERHQTNLLSILTKCAPQACAPREGAQVCATTPRCGRFKYKDTEAMKEQCKSAADGFEQLTRLVKSQLRVLATRKDAPQDDAMDAFTPFEAALTHLMNPTRQADVPGAKPTLLDLIRETVTDEFVMKHLPDGGVVNVIANFTAHVQYNVNTLLADEYAINDREEMCSGAYADREGVNDVTNTLKSYAAKLVQNFATTNKFVRGKERAATVTAVLTAAVKECLPEIWLNVWKEVSSTVYSLLCMVYGLQLTVYSFTFTVYVLRFTVYCLQFTSRVYCLLFTVYCLRFTVYCIRFSVYCLLFTGYWLLFIVYCLRFTVYGLLFTVYCLLSTVYCLRFTGRRTGSATMEART